MQVVAVFQDHMAHTCSSQRGMLSSWKLPDSRHSRTAAHTCPRKLAPPLSLLLLSRYGT